MASNRDNVGQSQNIGGIQRGREDDFYRMLAKQSCPSAPQRSAAGASVKQWMECRCEMTAGQAKQYNEFAKQVRSALTSTTYLRHRFSRSTSA